MIMERTLSCCIPPGIIPHIVIATSKTAISDDGHSCCTIIRHKRVLVPVPIQLAPFAGIWSFTKGGNKWKSL